MLFSCAFILFIIVCCGSNFLSYLWLFLDCHISIIIILTNRQSLSTNLFNLAKEIRPLFSFRRNSWYNPCKTFFLSMRLLFEYGTLTRTKIIYQFFLHRLIFDFWKQILILLCLKYNLLHYSYQCMIGLKCDTLHMLPRANLYWFSLFVFSDGSKLSSFEETLNLAFGCLRKERF